MKTLETVKQIVRDANMSSRPGYYSGRGATLSDLNSDILEKIYQGIDREFGNKASKAFIQMVKGAESLSATWFLTALYSLYYNDWDVSKVSGDKNHFDGVGEAIGGMLSAIAFGSSPDYTENIRYNFLVSHKQWSPPKSQYKWYGYE